MTISNVLEHWATIYKPLSHKSDSGRLEDQSFFRIRYIDLENIFQRNANIIHSPCMLQSVISTGEFSTSNKMLVSHQIWFLAKVKDTAQTLGRFNGEKLEQTSEDLMDYCKDLVSWLVEVKRTGKCPVTGRSFAEDSVILAELQSIDVSSITCGLIGELYAGQWLVAGVDWKNVQPLYKFGCGGNGKYNTTVTE
jgi:hypothetical protein